MSRPVRPKLLAIAALLALGVLLLGYPGCRVTRPGPEPAPAPREELIRVKLAGPADSIPVAVEGPFTVHDHTGRIILRAGYLPKTQMTLMSNELVLTDEDRRPIRDFLDLVPENNGTLLVDDRPYCGSLRIHRVSAGQLLAVNHLGIEDYLKGVLRAELPHRFLPETYKAQAVAARTFALYEKFTRSPGKNYDVEATEASQVYAGLAAHTRKASSAVDQTRGIVLTGLTRSGWRIFPAFFSSTCGGWTQPGRYLAAVDPLFGPLRGNVRCDTCDISPYYQWGERRFAETDVVQRLNAALGLGFHAPCQVDAVSTTRYGRITLVKLTDPSGTVVSLPGEKFRLIIGSRELPSMYCRLRKDGSDVVFFEGRGFGHGVGMCQYGAEGMARKGRTAAEILSHYYPSARLVRVY